MIESKLKAEVIGEPMLKGAHAPRRQTNNSPRANVLFPEEGPMKMCYPLEVRV